MSSAGSSIVADVGLRPSLRAVQWAFWLHALPAVALPFATTETLYALPLLALIAISWVRVRRHAALGFGGNAIRRILARQDGSWWIERADGGGEAVRLLPDSVMTGWLLVLRFRFDNGKSATRLILGDEADEDALRRLRVRLGSWREADAQRGIAGK
jgi:hypothetical protein